MWWTAQTSQKYRLPHLPNAIPPPPPPNEHALYKYNFATRNGELSKVIADIAQRDGNVFLMFHEQMIEMRIAYLQ